MRHKQTHTHTHTHTQIDRLIELIECDQQGKFY